jgi:hypothetical protein
MKRLILSIIAIAAITACEPEAYIGPLDSPVGSWDGVKAEYYFKGNLVGEAEECQYSAISFYKDGLCCIEGLKGALPYTYEHSSGTMVIENTIWAVPTLTGAEMVLKYLETTYQTESTFVSEMTLPVEYKGTTINADDYGYYYETGQNDKVYCNFFGGRDESGTLVIDFWYDTHTDYFIPLVVEAKK